MKLFSEDDLQAVYANNPIAATIDMQGGDIGDVAVALSRQNEALMQEMMVLQMIAPRRFRVAGVEYVYRCPDHAVPVRDFSTVENLAAFW